VRYLDWTHILSISYFCNYRLVLLQGKPWSSFFDIRLGQKYFFLNRYKIFHKKYVHKWYSRRYMLMGPKKVLVNILPQLEQNKGQVRDPVHDFAMIAHLCWMPGQGVYGGLVVGEKEAGGRLLLIGSQVEELELTAHVGGHNLRGPGEDDVSEGAAVPLLVHLSVHCSFNQRIKNSFVRIDLKYEDKDPDFLLNEVTHPGSYINFKLKTSN